METEKTNLQILLALNTLEQKVIQNASMTELTKLEVKDGFKQLRDEIIKVDASGREEVDNLEEKYFRILFEPEKGIVTRVDRIEQAEQRRSKILGAIIGVLSSVVIKIIADWMGKK